MSNQQITLEQYCPARLDAGGGRPGEHKRPGPAGRYRPEEVAEAIRRAGGNQRQAARLLGCWEKAVHKYVRRYPEVRAALEECRPRLKSAEEIMEAVRQTGGHRAEAAKLLGMDRSTLLAYLRRYPAVREACEALDRSRCAGPPPRGRFYNERYSPGKVAEALRLAAGIKAEAARRLGCTRGTVDRYIRRHPEVQEAWVDARETMVDLAESKLQEAVERGEWPAVHYTLSTLGKDRGFTTRPAAKPARPIPEFEQLRAQLEADIARVYGKQEDVEEEASSCNKR